jgi:hypothetical protein
MVRGDIGYAREHARAAAPLLDRVPDALRMFGQDLEAITVLIQGNLREALDLFESRGIFRADHAASGGRDVRADHAASGGRDVRADHAASGGRDVRVDHAASGGRAVRATEGKSEAETNGASLMAMANGAFALWLAGKPDDALDLARRGYGVAEALDDPWERAALLGEWAVLHALRREPVEARELANRSLALAEDGGFGAVAQRSGLVLRWAEAELAPAEVKEQADELLSKPWKSVSFGRTLPWLLFASTCARLGRTDAALRVVSEALGSLGQSEERWLEPELHRLRGEIVASRDVLEAERSFATAIRLARSHGATSLELRATLSLHELVSGAAKTRARDELARLLTLVAGGEGAPDVAEARRVLREHEVHPSAVDVCANRSDRS